MDEVIILSIILVLLLALSGFIIYYFSREKRRPLDYYGLILGVVLFDVFIIILMAAVIFGCLLTN